MLPPMFGKTVSKRNQNGQRTGIQRYCTCKAQARVVSTRNSETATKEKSNQFRLWVISRGHIGKMSGARWLPGAEACKPPRWPRLRRLTLSLEVHSSCPQSQKAAKLSNIYWHSENTIKLACLGFKQENGHTPDPLGG